VSQPLRHLVGLVRREHLRQLRLRLVVLLRRGLALGLVGLHAAGGGSSLVSMVFIDSSIFSAAGYCFVSMSPRTDRI
jgi:hypothetical protein